MTAHLHTRPAPETLIRRLLARLPVIAAACCLSFQAAAATPAAATPARQPAAQAVHTTTTAKRAPVRKSKSRKAISRSKARSQQGPVESDLVLKSNAALVVDLDTGEALALKNADEVLPIASLTKLMTGLVVLDAKLPMDEVLEISKEDVDTERNTHSRLTVGTRLTRDEMLLLALMSSENRAALALSRNFPGGRAAFITRMNLKAQALGMVKTHFGDPAGLSNLSVSTARDLHHLVSAAYAQPLMRRYTTMPESTVQVGHRTLNFINSNRLVRSSGDWNIELQKTGFTNEAGRCLVMHVTVMRRRLAMIFLDSDGTMTRYADAARVRRRVEQEAKFGKPKADLASAAASSS